MRGEYGANLSQYTDAMELPPRARRIRWSERQKGNHHGTTSACAENTGWWGAHQHIDGNYLRVRGEYCVLGVNVMANRTTSACAENTGQCNSSRMMWGNYLRVRGEYAFLLRLLVAGAELPPRARRIQRHTNRLRRGLGTTSACAENTKAISAPGQYFRNYLRVRGEYTASARTAPDLW